MPLYAGGRRIARLYRGANAIARAYKGAAKVFDAAEDESAFPAVAASNTSANNSAQSSHSVNLPASIAAGDLLVIGIAAARRNASNVRVDGTFSTPSGWTELFQATNPSNNDDVRLAVYSRVASGSEGAAVSVATANNTRTASLSLRITGAEGSIASAHAAANGQTSSNAPNLAPSWGAAKTLWLFFDASSGHGSPSSGAAGPSGFGNIVASATTLANANGCAIRAAWKEDEVAALDPAAFALGVTADWVAATAAVRPL
jgi:hypothetical protein